MGYGDYLREQKVDTSRLDILLSLASYTPTITAFLPHLHELRQTVERTPVPSCPFVLSTIHASKGLEYDRVILIDAVDGLFPTDPLPQDEDGKAALEEDRRLFYVGATRARHQLELLCYESKFGEPAAVGHTFIDQLLGEDPTKIDPAPAPKQARTRRPAYGSGPSSAQVSVWIKDYIPGTTVVHTKFGRGEIVSLSGDIAVIRFDDHGSKKLALSFALQKELIHLAER